MKVQVWQARERQRARDGVRRRPLTALKRVTGAPASAVQSSKDTARAWPVECVKPHSPWLFRVFVT